MEDLLKMIIDDFKNELKKKIDQRLSERYKGIFHVLWPPVDVVEDKDQISVFVDLPGFDKNDINLNIVDNYLKITAQKKPTEYSGIVHLKERPDHVHRYVKLPAAIDKEHVTATYKDGLLNITLPLMQRTSIKIQ